MNHGFFIELEEILADGYTGDLLLHCDNGRVAKYEIRQVKRPRAEFVDLTEAEQGLTRKTG